MKTAQLLYRLPKCTLKFLMVYLFLEIIDLNCKKRFWYNTIPQHAAPEKNGRYSVPLYSTA